MRGFFRTASAIAIILSLSLPPILPATSGVQAASVSRKVLGDLLQVRVSSPIEVGAYQLVFFTDDTIRREGAVTGFMNPSIQLDWQGEYRWFGLFGTGGVEGSLTIVFDGCVTLERVNLLDMNGEPIPVSGHLPVTVCEREG